jgi:hypothetical protein
MRMADDARERISDIYESLKAEKDKMDKKIDDQKKDLEEIQSKYTYLENSSEYGAKAKPILEEIKREIEETKTVKDSVMRDFNSFTNVSNGIMKGANNPQVRAAMDYGMDQHEKKQKDLGCDDKEVEVAGGRKADCVKFTESDGCVVIEIKPDTYSESKAIAQAKSYIDGLKSKYKDNDKAKKNCKQDSDGNWIFKPDWDTYPACKPGRL